MKSPEFEDGQRIDTERGRYEWWYFDSHLDNGATVVVVFGWSKTVGGLTQVKVRGIEKVRAVFVLAMAAYNIVRLPQALRPEGRIAPANMKSQGNVSRYQANTSKMRRPQAQKIAPASPVAQTH